jgi:hypothetical protein
LIKLATSSNMIYCAEVSVKISCWMSFHMS